MLTSLARQVKNASRQRLVVQQKASPLHIPAVAYGQ
jgi:hypothetical protein